MLSALDADRDLFNAELILAQSQRDELLALVQLYKALGGGWNLTGVEIEYIGDNDDILFWKKDNNQFTDVWTGTDLIEFDGVRRVAKDSFVCERFNNGLAGIA